MRTSLTSSSAAEASTLPASASPTHTTNVAHRKLKFLAQSGLFGRDTRGAVIERACTPDDLCQAYRLVQRVYLRSGFLKPEPSGIRLRIFETSSETATFVAKKDGIVVGVLSIVGDSPELGLPSDLAFRTELDRLRRNGRRLFEVTNQVVAEDFCKTAVTTELMRCAIAHAIHEGYDEGIGAISPSHEGFYQLIGFRRLGSERSYSDKVHDPVIAVRLDIRPYRTAQPTVRDEVRRFVHRELTEQNQFLQRVTTWAQRARDQFLNLELLTRLFVTERNFLEECTTAELLLVQRLWGKELFADVHYGRPVSTGS